MMDTAVSRLIEERSSAMGESIKLLDAA